jgi:CRISPR/Cas system-associated exonuclease Cas4 (RecB family)
MSFLESVATHLYRQFGSSIADCAIIFPNKRPAIYFRQHLGKQLATPIWSPDIFTIHEFIQESTQGLSADRLLCSFLLYESYREVLENELVQVVPYERFYPLGEILLNDFTELESNVVSINDLYTNLAELAAIDQGLDYLTEEQLTYLQNFWKNFSVQKLSQQKERFLQLWKNLPAVFELFRKKLSERGLITTGMIYRSLVTGDYENKDFPNKWKKLVFVGFNALNRAELQVLQKWQEEGRALFYFDTDIHYIEDELQEAGRFLRRNLGLFRNQLPMENSIRRSDRPIQVIAAEGNAAQVRMLPALLKEIPSILEEPEQTAVLLADENLLLPVLHALPDWIQQVNITMGYGLMQSPLYSLIQTMIHVQESLLQNKGRSVYFRPLLQLVQHPYLYKVSEAKELAEAIQQKSLVSIPAASWANLEDIRLKKAMEPVKHPLELIAMVREVLEIQAAVPEEERSTELDTQLLLAAQLQLNRLEDLLRSFQEELSIAFVGEIMLQVMRSQSVPLEGEPLKGLQIMGLLESRALDFKNIILLNVNEGILPKKAAAPTFIPDSVRRAYGLSVLENQDAIFAYVFYRLLQRSEKMTCLYNSTVDEKGLAEQSRFLTQLEYETEIPLIKKTVRLQVVPQAKPPIVIEKDEGVMKTMRKYASEKMMLSPSAINTYLDCRLRFYFQQVQSIREPEELEEEISPRVLGNLLHRSIEFLYRGLEERKSSRLVEPDDFDWLQGQVDPYLQEALGHELAKDRTHLVEYTGTLRVVEEVVRTYLKEILKQDKAWAPFTMVEQELKISFPLSVEVNGENWTIRLGGYIDRIDKKEGFYRIIDYKTGSDKKEFRSVDTLFMRDRADRNKAVLQTLLYAELLRQKIMQVAGRPPAQALKEELGERDWMREQRGIPGVQAGLYDVRSMRKDGTNFDWRFVESGIKSKLDDHRIREIVPELMNQLKQTVEEIFNRNQPFDQTTRREKCEYCPYQKICGR